MLLLHLCAAWHWSTSTPETHVHRKMMPEEDWPPSDSAAAWNITPQNRLYIQQRTLTPNEKGRFKKTHTQQTTYRLCTPIPGDFTRAPNARFRAWPPCAVLMFIGLFSFSSDKRAREKRAACGRFSSFGTLFSAPSPAAHLKPGPDYLRTQLANNMFRLHMLSVCLCLSTSVCTIQKPLCHIHHHASQMRSGRSPFATRVFALHFSFACAIAAQTNGSLMVIWRRIYGTNARTLRMAQRHTYITYNTNVQISIIPFLALHMHCKYNAQCNSATPKTTMDTCSRRRQMINISRRLRPVCSNVWRCVAVVFGLVFCAAALRRCFGVVATWTTFVLLETPARAAKSAAHVNNVCCCVLLLSERRHAPRVAKHIWECTEIDEPVNESACFEYFFLPLLVSSAHTIYQLLDLTHCTRMFARDLCIIYSKWCGVWRA